MRLAPYVAFVLAAALGAVALSASAVPVAAVQPRAAEAPPPGDAEAYAAGVAAAVDSILADPELPRAFWGLLAVDLATGRTVLRRDADQTFLPASTMKLLTTAAALDELGADHRYVTRLYHLGTVTDRGEMRGDLVIRGGGDPSFGSEWIRENPLEAWAEALAEAGVRRVTGRILGDDDRFADEPYAEGWDVSHIASETYAPPAGGLAWNDNLLPVRIAGGRATAGPPGMAEVVASVEAGRRGRFQVRRVLGTDDIEIRGTIPSGYRGAVEVPVENPTRYAAFALADALRDAGIAVEAEIADADVLASPPEYGAAEPLRATVSPPLSEIIERINRKSDNLYAEHVFRSLTPEGTLSAAAGRVRALLRAAGAETDGLSIQDGSGLSRKDLITPDALGALLVHMDRHPERRAFRASLADGGGAGSTLRNRLRGVPVRAKTGSLLSARALAGYVRGPQRQQIAFVIFANHYTTSSGRITGAIDDIVRALAAGTRVPREAPSPTVG